jgi:hypothetical protein
MEMSANRLAAGDWYFVTSKLLTEVIGNGGRDAAVSEVPISAGLRVGQWREPEMSHYGTGLT